MSRAMLNAFLLVGSGTLLLGQDAKKLIGPAIEQRMLAVRACLTQVPPPSLPAKRACLHNSYNGGSLEQLVTTYYSFASEDAKLGDAVAALIAARDDKQVGAAPDTGGTTALAMKGYAPRILSLAVERGAITQQVDKNLVTFRATPAGLVDALRKIELTRILGFSPLAGQPVASGGNPKGALPGWAYRLSLMTSFDTNRGGEQGTLLANRQQIASWGARYVLVNHRDAELQQYSQRWINLANAQTANYVSEITPIVMALGADNRLIAVLSDLRAEIDTAITDADLGPDPATSLEKLEPILRQYLLELVDRLEKEDPKLPVRLRVRTLKPYFGAQTDIYKIVNKGMLATVDYTVVRDPLVPDLSTITVIAETGFGPSRKMEWLLNAAFSFYNADSPQITQRFHSTKITTEVGIPLGKFADFGPFTLALAGRYQNIPVTTVSPGTAIAHSDAGAPMALAAVTPSGHVGVGQVKLTIPMKDSGIKVPFSFSVSNRAGMIEEKTSFSATVGLTFDLDALFAKSIGK